VNLGPNVLVPPRPLIAAIEARWPGFFRDLAESLDRALDGLDATVVNWFRDAEHNRAVGGAVGSQHRWAAAFDIVVPRAQWSDAARRLRAEHFFVIDEGDHLHAQAFPAGALSRSGIAPG